MTSVLRSFPVVGFAGRLARMVADFGWEYAGGPGIAAASAAAELTAPAAAVSGR